MSAEMICRAWKVDCGSSSSKLLLLALADETDWMGYSRPNLKNLEEKCSLSKASINNSISKLKELGLITELDTAGVGGLVFKVMAVKQADKTEGGADEPESKEVSAYSESFEKFWAAYPRKSAKGLAAKAWNNAKLPDISVVLAAVEAQCKSPQWTKDDGQFIPYPATWINQKRWDDGGTLALPSVPPATSQNQIRKGYEDLPEDQWTEAEKRWYSSH